MPDGSTTLKPFDFALVREQLKELLQTIEEQLKREVPKKIAEFGPGLPLCILVPFRLARQTFDAIVYLCANKVGEEPLPRPEFALVVPSLNRSILDSVMGLVFLLEDLPDRWMCFLKAGWREMKLESGRLEKDFGDLATVKEWLENQRPLIEAGPSILGLSASEAEAPETLPKWPHPGGMKRRAKGAVRTFLQRLDDLFYIDLSQQAHVSYLGVMKTGQHLLQIEEGDSEERRERLKGYASDQVFTAITLMLVLCSVLDERFQLGRGSQIRIPWSVVGEYWEPAKLLQEIRYAEPLFPASGTATKIVAPAAPLGDAKGSQ